MQTFKATINGVPVEFELVQVGSDSQTVVSQDVIIKDGNGGGKAKAMVSTDQSLRVITVGSDKTPASPKDVANVHNVVTSTSAADLIANLIDSIKNNPVGKELWQSKTVWVNIIAIAATISAHYGFDWKAHGIDEQTIVMVVTTALGIINVVLRKGTDTPLNTPSAESVKNLLAPLTTMFLKK